MKAIKRTLAVLLTMLMLMSVVSMDALHVSAADQWVNDGTEVSVERVKAWPTGSSATAGFCTSNSYYTKYNKSLPGDTSTTRYVVTNEETIGYLYWHWCYTHDLGRTDNCAIKGSKNGQVARYDANGKPTGTYYTTSNFHAFFSTSKLSYTASAHAFSHNKKADCPYTYWWVSKTFNAQGDHNAHLEVVKTTYQKQVLKTIPDEHTVTYNYAYNGGVSASKTTASVEEGATIDLTPTAAKPDWDFVGWNTDPAATQALSSLTMGDSDVILYAIFKQTLTKKDNATSIRAQYDAWVDGDQSIHLVVKEENAADVFIPAVPAYGELSDEQKKAYDIKLVDQTGNEVQRNVIVWIPLPEGFNKNNLEIYHRHSDRPDDIERITDYWFEPIDGVENVVFVTDSFSVFILVDTSEPQPDPNMCHWCGQVHTGFFGGFVAFFHRIFAKLFGEKY